MLGDASGVGRYTASLTLPASWRAADGAYLDLGPVNQVHPVIDLGAALRPGGNTLTVTVATTLLNGSGSPDPPSTPSPGRTTA
jgi:hypothetical protein